MFEQWAQRIAALEEGWRTGDEWKWWLAWTYPYPNANVNLSKTTWLDPKVIRQLMEPENVAAPFVQNIRTTISTLEGSS